MNNLRIHSVDALRGFALAGIVLTHMVENYLGSIPPVGVMDATNEGIASGIVNAIVFIFLRGKFFALFSFLFGLSFFLQQERGKAKEEHFGPRFLWRLVLLFAIGAVHHLFYRGDILTIYAVIGVLLIPLSRLSSKWLTGIVVLLFLGTARYVVFGANGSGSLLLDFEMVPEAPEVLAYFETIKNGSLSEVFATNATEGFAGKVDFQLGFIGRGYLTLAFFLLGMIAGRRRFFEAFHEKRQWWRKLLYWSIGLMVLSFVPMGILFSQNMGENQMPNMNSWATMFAFTFMDLWNLFMTAILILGFMLLYTRKKTSKLNAFAPYGRMALSNYVAQTLLGTCLLYGWGFGMIGELPASVTFLIGVVIVGVQMIISRWWLGNFRYGPLEWLWRSLTYFRWFALRK